MISWPNTTPDSASSLSPRDLQKSECVLGFIPIIYYSALLCVGVPVNVLTAVAFVALFIVFVGFLLETAVFHRKVPALLLHHRQRARVRRQPRRRLDRRAANGGPLRGAVPPAAPPADQLPRGARGRIVAGVFTLALASGVPFFWWTDLWREGGAPTGRDTVLIWAHVTIIYFLPCAIFLVLNSLIVLRAEGAGAGGVAGMTAPPPLPAPAGEDHGDAPGGYLVVLRAVGRRVRAWSYTTCTWRRCVVTGVSTWPTTSPTCWPCSTTAVNFFLYCFTSQPFRAGSARRSPAAAGGGRPTPATPSRPRPRPATPTPPPPCPVGPSVRNPNPPRLHPFAEPM
ncbi:hypothetical protein SKAU_G00235810 [Synaphobranchus kaupii]|uniref:G-protein coupled receptors family 1 profile domain-containing protein n=1 Tax=Synaphobranchus kaupii TaxID=118154 RepID=A0A9Q1ISU3_SYNKA|nr:hypothetical protein SKAU_G00235810 [Synaphobranchus kaupii]